MTVMFFLRMLNTDQHCLIMGSITGGKGGKQHIPLHIIRDILPADPAVSRCDTTSSLWYWETNCF